MNKNEFIGELASSLNYEREKCVLINDILESNFFISKRSKEPIIKELIIKLNVEEAEAGKIYDTAIALIKKEVKSSLKHPFKNKD